MTFVLFCHEMSLLAGFVRSQGLSDGEFCSFTRFQWQSVFTVSQFCSVTRSQFRLFYPFYEISTTVGFVLLMTLVSSHHVILVIALFFPLQDFKDSEWWSVLFLYKTSVMVGFFPLFLYSFSKMFCFVSYRHFSDSWFCSVTRFQWWLVLFIKKISMTVGF